MKNMMADDGQLFPPYGATESLPVAYLEADEVLNDTWALDSNGWSQLAAANSPPARRPAASHTRSARQWGGLTPETFRRGEGLLCARFTRLTGLLGFAGGAAARTQQQEKRERVLHGVPGRSDVKRASEPRSVNAPLPLSARAVSHSWRSSGT